MERSTHKEASRQKILHAGASRLRKEGLSGAGISTVMKDADLTHGAFYAHFSSKEDMLVSAFRHALADNRPRWTSPERDEAWPDRLKRLSKRYLNRKHRDDLSTSCALAALLSDAARSTADFRAAYEEELLNSIDAICGKDPCDAELEPRRFDEAVMFFALCAGGISLSRAVDDRDFSDHILAICRQGVARMMGDSKKSEDSTPRDSGASKETEDSEPSLDRYPIRSGDKIRYADTDRRGHVNNAVFSNMIETGRVELLYHPDKPLAGPNCSFVIAGNKMDFLAQITWPNWVDIGTRILKVGRSSVTLETALFPENGSCAAVAQTVIVHMNNDTKHSQPFSTETKRHLEGLARPTDKLPIQKTLTNRNHE